MSWHRCDLNLSEGVSDMIMRGKKRVFVGWLICFVCVAVSLGATNIVLDGKSPGRVFEGIGALSAGASSRLLSDYPDQQKREILDFLFKPNYGASLHHLKVEIGGDVNSTDGCEPSHMHTRDEENYSRGYEWWLMKEAKARNPKIMLDALEWGAPAWIGNGKFYSQDNADYIAKFIKGNRLTHGVNIDYVGIWNERAYDIPWIKLLRKTLDEAGLKQVKIVAADEVNNWRIANAVAADHELAAAVSVVAAHYPNKSGYKTTDVAQKLDKPLWSSEDGPWNGTWGGAKQLARIYNRNYVIGRMVKTIIWSLVSSYYDNLPLPGSGLMKANTPWSGYYDVQPAIWATAHTTQFVQPGWKYLDNSCVLISGGSVVTLISPDGRDYSIIVETMDAKAAQELEFKIVGGMPAGILHVWRTDSKEQFVRVDDVTPENGGFAITVAPETIYTLTTTSRQNKGIPTPPENAPFPLPYNDDFEGYEVGTTARYLAEQAGIFEVVKRQDGKGKALRQVVSVKGIEWQPNPFPETIIGSPKWTDYEVSVDTLIEKKGFVSLFGRIQRIMQNRDPPVGYWLKVTDSGDWEIVVPVWKKKADTKKHELLMTRLASGKVNVPAESWHTLKLRFCGEHIKAVIDGNQVADLKDKTYAAGMVGIGSGWHEAQFDNLAIEIAQYSVSLSTNGNAIYSSEHSYR